MLKEEEDDGDNKLRRMNLRQACCESGRVPGEWVQEDDGNSARNPSPKGFFQLLLPPLTLMTTHGFKPVRQDMVRCIRPGGEKHETKCYV